MSAAKNLKIPIRPAEQVEEEAKLLISPAELAARLKADPKLVLVDVRSELEHRMLRLEGARLATRELVEEIFSKWDKATPIALYDHKGRDGLNAAKALLKRGFTDIKALAGGIDAWSQAVDPLIPRY
ncbi:MAG: rhodanese-like domain-containing protein [Elusimicrobia bacterium]|nr:rhodanese-like domain-containing protein [Elusimicrobiota bacterium]